MGINASIPGRSRRFQINSSKCGWLQIGCHSAPRGVIATALQSGTADRSGPAAWHRPRSPSRRSPLANNPLNLALRFALEITGLLALAYWGWTQHAGLARWLWSLGLPLLAAALWGTFRVPDDPGKAPVAVPGFARLILELTYFAAAIWALFAANKDLWAYTFAGLLLFHYVISYDRVLWLLHQPPPAH